MSATEQEYKDYIKELEQQIRLLNEIETCADPDAHEPELVEVEKHLRKRKYAGQQEELVKNLPHSKVLHTIDESEQI